MKESMAKNHERNESTRMRRVAASCALAAVSVAASTPAFAQFRVSSQRSGIDTTPRMADPSEVLEDVGIEQHLEAKLPLDATFVNTSGDRVTLGDAFDEVPVILTLNYVDCPQLCSMQLANLASTMAAIDLHLGRDYRVVTVSIDPNDTPDKALGLLDRYTTQYRIASEDAGIERDMAAADGAWTILVGDSVDIDRVAETVGFKYRWVPEIQEYAHQAATILCSPSGEVMRYLPGTDPSMAGELKLSLVEAGEGKVGSLWDNVFLNCLVYDVHTGRYSLAAVRLLKVAAALTVLAIATGFFFMKRGAVEGTGAHGGETQS